MDNAMLPLLLAAPWFIFGIVFVATVRRPRPLPPAGSAPEDLRDEVPGTRPLVSVVVPARNEAHNIERCLGSLTASEYPAFEVIVVDDHSEDGTAELARALSRGNASRIDVIDGAPLPEGWFGKPWACWQGARAARGDFLLFADADTVHAPDLLGRAVAGLEEDRADGLSLLGRQIMETFWERLVQPQVFVLLALRFSDLRHAKGPDKWQDAIANGQYILVRRSAYEAVGGHEAVRGEVVEDMRLAQELARGGHPLVIRRAEDAFATRMYRSLGDLVEGWSKNLAVGAAQAGHPLLGRLVLPGIVAYLVVLWIVPALVLVLAAAGVGGGALLTGATLAAGFGAVFWGTASFVMGASTWYGLLHPVGATVLLGIVVRSWRRGFRRIEWKGRSYAMEPE